ncbi:hypothetical protein SAMN04488238_104369 [Roseicitreum antarcticum]|uniref:Uncharacterized protein n=2 Tax=Roseicitreum antarcticum TaxID=564137 RepID=A0A1H2Y1G5_9RHOB|nr:hypothetical protein SAMN04488238_104369 [Roseicitreum antarcticum]
MQKLPENETPTDLRFLKLLVTALAGVMILGVVVVAATLVIRLSAPSTALALPDQITLPEGVALQAVTLARDWVVVVSEAGEILLYDRATGGLINRVRPD